MSQIKAQARKAAFAARKEAFRQGLDTAANRLLLDQLLALPGEVVAAYMPIRTEISPLETMQALHQAGRIVVVPVIRGKAQPLVFSRWTPEGRMIDGPFGALIPEVGALFDPDILITPLLAFDRNGFRLGYGGGFYDRTLEGLRRQKPTRAIGFAYAAQEVAQVPTEPTDQRLDMLVSEKSVTFF